MVEGGWGIIVNANIHLRLTQQASQAKCTKNGSIWLPGLTNNRHLPNSAEKS